MSGKKSRKSCRVSEVQSHRNRPILVVGKRLQPRRIDVENEFATAQEPFFGKHMVRRVSDVGIMSSHQRFSVDALRLCLGDHRKSRQEQKGQNWGRKKLHFGLILIQS